MSTDTKPMRDQQCPNSVHVAIYDHPHGTDVRVFRDRQGALNWRTSLAKEWWSNAYQDALPSDDVIGEEYFRRMLDRGEEFFSIQACDIETSDQAPADLTVPAQRPDDGVASC